MRISQFPAAVDLVGFDGALNLILSRRRLRRFMHTTGTVRLKSGAPFHFRRVSTDRYAFADVFLSRQYECLTGLADVRTIIDAGANVGTASMFLLEAFPNAHVVALEPDDGNFELLRQNLAFYGSRAVAVRKALWHRNEPLLIDRGRFRDGGEWSFQVGGAGAQPSDVQGVTLSRLMAEHGIEVIDLLKIDIEGAERWVLQEGLDNCLDRVKVMAIELHDASCRAAFEAATAGHRAAVSRHGEVTVWRRVSGEESPAG